MTRSVFDKAHRKAERHARLRRNLRAGALSVVLCGGIAGIGGYMAGDDVVFGLMGAFLIGIFVREVS